MLSKAIITEYHRINRVFASHIVAFVAFEMLRIKYPQFDLFNFLRLPEEDLAIDYEEFRNTFKRIRNTIFELYEKGQVDIAPHLKESLDDVIKHGLDNVGMYHAKRPVLRNRKGEIVTHDLNKLYYYHNRLEGYNLEKKI